MNIRRVVIGLLLCSGLSACAALSGSLESWVRPFELSLEHPVGDRYMGIRLLGALEIHSPPRTGVDIDELSGLAWHRSSGTLFAVTDGGGLHRFRPRFDGDILTGINWLGSNPLRRADGRPLTGQAADSEGLALLPGDGEAQLLVSFERDPRIVRYDANGTWLAEETLPERLRRIDGYAGRNSALEALGWHPRHGWITGPERPMRGAGDWIELAAQSGWSARFRGEPDRYSALTGMTTNDRGELLFIERRYRGMLEPLQIRIRHLDPERPDQIKTVAVFDNATGWRMDNFEAITHHRDNRYFAVSDNNGNPLQRSLLIYFEHLPDGR